MTRHVLACTLAMALVALASTAQAACADIVGAEAELVRCNALLARGECARAEAHCRVAARSCADDGRFASALGRVLKDCRRAQAPPRAMLGESCAQAPCGPGLACSNNKKCTAHALARVHVLERQLAGRQLLRHSPCDARHQVEVACSMASNAGHQDLLEQLAPELTRLRPACVSYTGPVCRARLDNAPMVEIPAGRFTRGSDAAALDRGLQLCRDTYSDGDQCTRDWFEREGPVRSVSVGAFAIDKHEVTNAQYAHCVGSGVCPPIDYGSCRLWQATGKWSTGGAPHVDLTKPDHPVICVRYAEAEGYCGWAGKRLPTEAEWERAARGDGDSRDFPWGNDWDPKALNWGELGGFGTQDGYATTSPVGAFPKNESPFGVRDMAGNAWEWVSDYFDDGYYADAPSSDPRNDRMSASRVMRGGSWSFAGNGARVAYRYFGSPEIRDDAVGFRCAGQSRGGR